MRISNFIFVILFLISACATPEQTAYVKDGRQYGITEGLFRDRWWNYFERGGSFSDGAFYDEAISDFRTAIRKRRDDQWRARTYGMHFMNYFPHRELGIVYFRQGRFEDAVKELETSLGTAESAKAKYFLNRARRALLEKSGADRLPPSLELTALPAVTNEFSITLSGVAKDDHFISSVKVNDTALPLELSLKEFPFETEIDLTEGKNEIIVIVEDLAGKAKEQALEINVDRRGPTVTIEDQKQTDGKVTVRGFLYDETGISYLAVNGKELTTDSKKEMSFKHETALSGNMDVIVIEAKDAAGNITRAELPAAPAEAVSREWPLLAYNGDLLALGLKGILDTDPPFIKLKGVADAQEVYDEDFLIEGSVTDDSKIKSLKINGEQVLRKKGSSVYFTHLAGLDAGINKFTIEAVDTFGNEGLKTVTVTRSIQKIRQLGSRMSIAVLPTERQGERSVAGDAVYDSLISAFVNQERFSIVERAKLEAVLRELKLGQTELVDPKTAAKAGKIAAADGIISATVLETGESIEVIARLIDTETSVVLSSNDAFDEEKGLMAVGRLMQGLAYKFKRDLPLLEGIIIEAKSGEILIDLGSEKKIRKNMKLILYREGQTIKHPVTGRVLGSRTEELGIATVKDVFDEFSSARIQKRDGALKVMDKVITR